MFKNVVLPVLLVAGGIAGAATMVATKPEVEVIEPEVLPPLVRVVPVELRSVRLDVRSQGTVLPRTETDLVAEVAGRIVAVSPDFEPGGFFARGEVLARIDDRDYELERAAAAAQVAQARVRLAREEAEAEVAAEEWREVGEGEASPLVLRQPQLEEARAMVGAAQATLERAELALERTRIRAPWSGRVRDTSADVGQFVNRGTPIARIHAVDYAEVRLPVPHEELRFLDVPLAAPSGGDAGGPALVLEADFAGERRRWTGRVARAEGELDPKTRMMSLVARVEDPYRRAGGEDGGPPLAVGLFVEATVEGRVVEGLAELPRAALRGDDRVLVVDGDGRLRMRDVRVLRRTAQTVVIESGLAAGERVCVSPLEAPVDGMAVRTVEDAGPFPSAEPASPASSSPPESTVAAPAEAPSSGR